MEQAIVVALGVAAIGLVAFHARNFPAYVLCRKAMREGTGFTWESTPSSGLKMRVEPRTEDAPSGHTDPEEGETSAQAESCTGPIRFTST